MSEKEVFYAVRDYISKCLQKDMCFDDIAGAIGVNRSTIYRWFSGYAMPSAYAYEKLKELCANKDAR